MKYRILRNCILYLGKKSRRAKQKALNPKKAKAISGRTPPYCAKILLG